MNIRNFRQGFASAAVTAGLLILATQAGAAPLAISDSPLFLTDGVKPNLIMAIDDSTSMDFELLLRGNDGAAWWRTKNSDSGECIATSGSSFVGCTANGTTDTLAAGQLNFNNAGNSGATWKKFGYLFPNGAGGGDTTDRRRAGDDTNDHYAIPPLPAYAWSRSPAYNAAYFNPLVTYTAWPNGGGYTFADSPRDAARFDPVFTGAGTINLTQDRAGTGSVATDAACDASLPAPEDNHYFRVYSGMTIPANLCIRVKNAPASTPKNPPAGSRFHDWALVSTAVAVGSTSGTSAIPSNSSVAIRYFPATFYLAQATLPAINYSATPASIGKAPDDTTLYRYEIKPGNFATTAAYNTAIQNFANWFTYYRKRHLALRAGLGTAFLSVGAMRVAGFTINESGSANRPNLAMGDIDDATNRTNLYTNFYHDWVRSGGTPNRAAVANVVRNYRRTDADAPIIKSCQRNFGMLFTDGFSNPPDNNDGITDDNVDDGKGPPYEDDVDGTLADEAMYAYTEPLRTDLRTGTVPLNAACGTADAAPGLDCNPKLHMNFFAVTLGARGLLFNPDNTANPYASPAPAWPSTFPARHPSAVDDLWHATINGRGQLLNAKSSSELSAKLAAVLTGIAESQGTAASAAASSGSIQTDTRLFQSSFSSADWSGNLIGFDVRADGTLGTGQSATFPAARQIMTVSTTGTATPFLWDSLDAARQSQINADAVTGRKQLSYLRGVQTDEAPNGAKFRKRSSPKLGDILNSAPTFVGAPPFRYPSALESKPYSAFKAANLNRPRMVYVGANDGMLHAFTDSKTTGPVERFAFIPGAVFKNLSKLTNPSYSHMFYADGTPTMGDAFIGTEWRTMLVAGLNKGGQSVYALDITDPTGLTENSTTAFKWEFDDADDADLGFTYSRPSIVRMANGKWAAIFGNGYNSTFADTYTSTTGKAYLYVVDLATGTLTAKIDTGAGSTGTPNGLSTPVMADLDGDGIADVGYAGDLLGNVWKFDFSSTTAANWKVANTATGATPVPFFIAKDSDGNPQPITTRPSIDRGPDGEGVIILFGTGKYLEAADTDVASLKTQSFYGLLDPNGGSVLDNIAGRDNLTPQTITDEIIGATFGSGATATKANVRVTSANSLSGTSRGWYIDLVSPNGFNGEMQVTDSMIRNGHIIYTTLIPADDPCLNGGTSWVMEMSLYTGSRRDDSPFDIDGDGKYDDVVRTSSGDSLPISGIQSTVGINPKGALISGAKNDFLYAPGSNGGDRDMLRVNAGPRAYGRQSWRQSR